MNTPAKSAVSKIKSQPAKTNTQHAEIEVINRQRLHRIAPQEIVLLGQAVLARIARDTCYASIVFLRDRAMRQLNRDYRYVDQPTDVLAFAYHERMSDNEPNHNPDFLGDVIISVETAARYANEQGITLQMEIDWLVIHGLLHLAGYDHETDNGEMRRLERRLRKELLSSR